MKLSLMNDCYDVITVSKANISKAVFGCISINPFTPTAPLSKKPGK